MRWLRDGHAQSLWSELLAWTCFVAAGTIALLWRAHDSIGLILVIASLPLVLALWAVGWGLIVIAMSSRAGSPGRGRRCPACGERVTATQQACSWCGGPLASEGRGRP